jgi:hypothetical protein
MLGPVILAVVIFVIIPVSIMMSLGVVAGLLGWALKDNGEATHEGSELIELS